MVRALSTTRVVYAEAPASAGAGVGVGAGAGAEKFSFQAETKQLLNIVANSLYTDKHVFIRCVCALAIPSSSLPTTRPYLHVTGVIFLPLAC